jgi:hypothetical protein
MVGLASVGVEVGAAEGEKVGRDVGVNVGDTEGSAEGRRVGGGVGDPAAKVG